MRFLCEASGLIVPPNADGRGTCPLCQTSWHSLTVVKKALRGHTRWRRDADPQLIAIVQIQVAAQAVRSH
jgi:hypothetical protein